MKQGLTCIGGKHENGSRKRSLPLDLTLTWILESRTYAYS